MLQSLRVCSVSAPVCRERTQIVFILRSGFEPEDFCLFKNVIKYSTSISWVSELPCVLLEGRQGAMCWLQLQISPVFLKARSPEQQRQVSFWDQLWLFVCGENGRDGLFLLYATPFFSRLI